MSKAINFTAGMATGAAIGMAIGAILDPINDKEKKMMQKKSSHIFKTIGTTIDGFIDMF